MSVRRVMFEQINRLLGLGGLHLTRTVADWDTSVPGEEIEALIHGNLAEVWSRWCDEIADAPPELRSAELNPSRFVREICNFIADYRRFKAKNNRTGGMFLNNTIGLFAVASYIQPDCVIDSGTFTGNSAWALRQACPKARVISCDISHAALRKRVSGIEYRRSDWTDVPLVTGPESRTLAFFDDHVDQILRIEESQARGIRFLVFDDDVPVNACHGGHDARSFPKISHAFAGELETCASLSWTWRNRRIKVPVDHERLARARRAIAYYRRLPDLFPVTGFQWQWPLSLVVLRERSDTQ